MPNLVERFWEKEEGQDVVEYAVTIGRHSGNSNWHDSINWI